MLALSLWQPWASLLVRGVKKVETRSWFPPESVRGRWVAVQGSACRIPRAELEQRAAELEQLPEGPAKLAASLFRSEHPKGAVVGLVRFSEFFEILWFDKDKSEATIVEHALGWNMSARQKRTATACELALGDWRIGRKLWFVEETIELVDPVACRGRQRVFRLPADVSVQVRERVRSVTGRLVT
jgi:hypothetical protein